MPGTLIIAYGNPLRGDDALGWRVAERLRERRPAPGVEILTVHQLMPELMDTLSRFDRAIFIDACTGDEPGAIVERDVTPNTGNPAAFTHHATPEALLAGARLLYGHAPEAVMISVVAADFTLGADLSPEVASQVDNVVAIVLRRGTR